jgi:glutamine synthetase
VRPFLAITAMLMLGACGIARQVDAQNHYQQSLADYRACLAANNANPQACEGKRLLMETDEHALDNSRIRAPSENYDITVRNR